MCWGDVSKMYSMPLKSKVNWYAVDDNSAVAEAVGRGGAVTMKGNGFHSCNEESGRNISSREM